MPNTIRVGVVSDIHYASARERERGNDFEFRGLANPLLRGLARVYRRHIWLRDPLDHNDVLDRFLARTGDMEYLVANGDYSCNSAFIGLSDDAACQSARECLGKLRERFGSRLFVTYGDHDLGKLSFFGRRGGMPLASWRRAEVELGPPLWQTVLGRHVLLGFASSLVALPVLAADLRPAERDEWEKLRAGHLAQIRRAFEGLQKDQRLLLFCHDPTALAFLWQEKIVREKFPQLDQTVIGHLHSDLVLNSSRWLAGMPTIRFLGHNVEKLSRALGEAKYWWQFRARLCPSLAGIQLSRGGGYCTLELDVEGGEPPRFAVHPLPRGVG